MITINKLKSNISLEEMYELKNTSVSYNEFINNIVNTVNDNKGTLEDAIFIVEDAINKLENKKNRTQITEHDANGYEWVVDVCEYLDNQEALESALKEINANYKVLGNGDLYANIEDVKRADKHAYNNN